MRVGILSDIHANWPALQGALAVLDRENVDRVFCLGDIVGYYTEPAECVEELIDRGVDEAAGRAWPERPWRAASLRCAGGSSSDRSAITVDAMHAARGQLALGAVHHDAGEDEAWTTSARCDWNGGFRAFQRYTL